MDIDGTFLPVAIDLINNVFPTDIVYRRVEGRAYDVTTGRIEETIVEYDIKAGILSRARTEEGGVGETYSLELWIQHSSSGLPFLPRTGDFVVYDDVFWKVSTAAPTYSSKALIASKLFCLAD